MLFRSVFHIRNVLHLFRTLKRWERQLRDGTYHQMQLKSNVTDLTSPQLTILAQFPGIGIKRGQNILHVYKSLRHALNLVDQWADDVDDIGPMTVWKVKEMLRDERTDVKLA